MRLPPFHVENGEYLPTFAQFTRGMLLNHDCDLVREEEETWLVAMVRPMSGVHGEDRQTIRENRNYSHLYVPADASFGIDEEGYVDLRQITSLHRDTVKALWQPRASLTEVGCNRLRHQLLRFFLERDQAN